MNKYRLMIGVLATGVVAIVSLLLLSPGRPTVSAQEQRTTRIEQRSLNTTIETTGTIAPEDEVQLAFGMSGRVSAILIEVGAEVRAGEVLARLDTTDLLNQIARQEQSLIVQQAAYDRLTAAPTAREITQAEAALAAARSQLAQAQTGLETITNTTTINCAGVANAALELERATDTYADYVAEGYRMDATFIPDPDSAAGERLRVARSSDAVARAQCQETPPISQLEAAVAAAQSSVEQAQAALDDLLRGPAEDEITSAQAQLDQAALQLENARAALEDAVIVAPFDGLIAGIQITRGQQVNASTGAIILVDISQLHINVSVDELDIAQVVAGQAAVIAPEALDAQTMTGSVTRIAPISTIIDGVVTYEVRVDITTASNLPVRAGMTTTVEIVVGSLEDVLVIPTEAIQREAQAEFVEVLNADNSITRVAITAGATIDGLTAIEGDLTAGLTVIIPERTAAPTGSGLPFAGGN
ncbi:MAG: efflux RND transporter periplasmic adaptor subunit [Anaerolineae bacterium]|nr:efflux RND transporter periplasmic adaptor subunit [Anaerolineae bacterium]